MSGFATFPAENRPFPTVLGHPGWDSTIHLRKLIIISNPFSQNDLRTMSVSLTPDSRRFDLPLEDLLLATAAPEPVGSTVGALLLPTAKLDLNGAVALSRLKQIPAGSELRAELRLRCSTAVRKLPRSAPLSQDELIAAARRVLREAGEAEESLGWTMVVLASEFWRPHVAATAFARRLLLLPPEEHAKVLRNGRTDYGSNGASIGPHSHEAGWHAVSNLRRRAEELGYKVLTTDRAPQVLELILSGSVAAVLGVADLTVLEKALDKILPTGIPCMAVPLLSNSPIQSEVPLPPHFDHDWANELIELLPANDTARNGVQLEQPGSYVNLLRGATRMFERAELEKLLPRQHRGPSLAEANGRGISGLDPIAGTEAIAYDFLARGGKHSRPFITLAVYDALTGGAGTGPNGEAWVKQLSPAVQRVAMSIETFHKASLVHDDIEDDDQFRYGEPTLHRKYGTPIAINVGDYLIGLGYRLVSRETKTLGADVVADILDRLADAHLKLAEGQGAELLWRDSRDKQLTPRDALTIYALKTAPAFEAALFSGMRLTGPVESYAEAMTAFARHLGTAFQILNDLADWRGDDHNKLLAAGDVLGGRPTVLWALALEGLHGQDRMRLRELAATAGTTASVLEIKRLYTEAGAFVKADELIRSHREQAAAIADQIEPAPFRRLLHFLIHTVLG